MIVIASMMVMVEIQKDKEVTDSWTELNWAELKSGESESESKSKNKSESEQARNRAADVQIESIPASSLGPLRHPAVRGASSQPANQPAS